MMLPYLPSVLQASNRNSLSMERALKQIKELLEGINIETPSDEDKVNTSIDDIDTMLSAINRE